MRNTAKIILNALRTLSFRKILKLAALVVPHPLFALLAFYATVKSFVIAQRYFPETNSTDGIGNAFRHALWSCLIMMYCCKISSPKKSYAFGKRMTDLHEELFPNEPLQTKMDLHNNAIGFELFMELLPGIHRQFFEKSFFIDQLLDKVKTAKILNSIEENHAGNLVYLKT